MSQTLALNFDPGSEPHAPGLYQPGGLARAVPTLGHLDAEAVAFYHEHGYLAVERVFSGGEVKDAIDAMVALINGEQPEFDGVWYEAEARQKLDTLSSEERQDWVRKFGGFVKYDPRLRAMAEQPALLDALRRLMGGRSPSMFQDMGLIKPPRIGREKPWHQDHAYFTFPLGTPVVGVWIALDEATVENGCMQLLPGRHKEGPIIHFKKRDWQICDDAVLGQQSVAAPLAPGGALFFDGLLPHGTPHNNSPKRRRALQFHYAPADAVRTSDEARLSIFGSEGKNVTC